VIRAAQSLLFSIIYSIYLVVVMLPFQGLVLRPLCALNPKWRPAILRWWFRFSAEWVVGMARVLGGLRYQSDGPLPAEPLILVMNHQSLLDIPAGVALLRGPYPVIPTRDLYTKWIPGISGLAQLAGFPALKQSGRASRAEHQALVAAAEAVQRGDRTMLIYPEGHRSKGGALLPFAAQGLKLVFRHAQRPVYMAVNDGAWKMRGFADIMLRLSGQNITVRVHGPYTVPALRSEHDAFVARLEADMASALARQRGTPSPAVPLARTAPLVG
jgi:1-acyl-sn-glycerol-3-phosphate acyltransferase